MPPKKKTSQMSDAHKTALAEGRTQGRAVRLYLEALDAHKPKRGRRRTQESIKKRLEKIADEITTADRLRQLQLVQERIDLEAELQAADHGIDLAELEQDFVAAAAPYSQRKGISYNAWRELGVPAATLKAAGISRGA